jgi:multiple sugar transport system permease protein
MGDLEVAGDEADIRYRARNSSRKSDIADVVMTDDIPSTLNVLSFDERCKLEGAALRCDLGDYEAGKREDIIVRIAATQAFLDEPVNIKDTKPMFTFIPENILTNGDFTLDNFRKVFNASDFWTVLWASLYYTIAGTVGALVMGLFAAQLMNITFRGRSFLRGLYLSPYVAPVIAVALAWVLLLDPGPGGTLNALLIQLGVIDGPINFLGQRKVDISIFGLTFGFPVALTVVIIFEIWRYFPLAMLFILARMQSMNTDIYEAAEIDGATPLQQFRFISLPQLMGIMAVLFLLRFIWTFNKFDDIFLLTGGAAGTRTLTVNVYEQAFAVSNLGAGAAVAVVVFLVLLCFSVIFFKFSPEDEQ